MKELHSTLDYNFEEISKDKVKKEKIETSVNKRLGPLFDPKHIFDSKFED
jgi:hypothetical protein